MEFQIRVIDYPKRSRNIKFGIVLIVDWMLYLLVSLVYFSILWEKTNNFL